MINHYISFIFQTMLVQASLLKILQIMCIILT